ncbi:MAG TPA: hypothetical protein PKE47_05300, partial [Verrucomicrobiota bacterium]|nr:hypothetical protein [Verrucomicrobiota bacterium]
MRPLRLPAQLGPRRAGRPAEQVRLPHAHAGGVGRVRRADKQVGPSVAIEVARRRQRRAEVRVRLRRRDHAVGPIPRTRPHRRRRRHR